MAQQAQKQLDAHRHSTGTALFLYRNRFFGIFYLCWIPMPLAFTGYLFFQHRRLFFEFFLTFLLVNLPGFALYYGHPAAPLRSLA